MAKFAKKYNFSAKGILYIEEGIIFIENAEMGGELVPITQFLEDFIGKECAVTVNYTEDMGEA